MIRSKPNDNNTSDTEVISTLKYLINFWRFSDLNLFNCEVELDLLWSKYCTISEVLRAPPIVADINPVPDIPAAKVLSMRSAIFQTNSTKPFVPIVTIFKLLKHY